MNSGSASSGGNLVPVPDYQSALERRMEQRKRRRRLDLKSGPGVIRERIKVYRTYAERMERCRTAAERDEAGKELRDRNVFLKDQAMLVTVEEQKEKLDNLAYQLEQFKNNPPSMDNDFAAEDYVRARAEGHS